VLLVTSSRELDGPSHHAAIASTPTSTREGCWLGARISVLLSVPITTGNIVAAVAVMIDDLEPNASCGGVPAPLIHELRS